MDSTTLSKMLRKGETMFAFILRERAIRYLAGHCDGAAKLDGVGYNRTDTIFGHSLSEQIGNSTRREGLRLTVRQNMAGGAMIAKYTENQILPAYEDLIADLDETVLEDWPELAAKWQVYFGICAQTQEDPDHAAQCFANATRICSTYGIGDDQKREIWRAAKKEHRENVAAAQDQAASEVDIDGEIAHERMMDRLASPTDPREMQAIAEYEELLADRAEDRLNYLLAAVPTNEELLAEILP